jgi:predicted DNA-binding transcriptional regulator YafY
VRMVTTGQRWYLMAWDTDREDWRTFRLDRIDGLEATSWRFRLREHPDPVGYVQDAITTAPYRYHARVRLRAPADHVRRQIPPAAGRVDEDRDGWCILTAGADDLGWLAMHIAALQLETEILDPPELREAAARLAGQLARIAGTEAS